MTGLRFLVVGTPQPQGSKRAFVNRHTGRAVVVDNNTKALTPWREAVKTAAIRARQAANHQTLTGPVAVELSFFLPRPKSHYRTGRNAHLLRDDAPTYVATKPDLDKIVRSTWDALTDAGVWRDDSQVADLVTSKGYCDHDMTPGCNVYVMALDPTVTIEPAARVVETPTVQGSLL